MRRAHVSPLTLLFSVFCLVGPLRAQTPPRTVRVATIGHVGTPHALSVTAEGAWRLIDLGDHRLVSEGTGPGEWEFQIGRDGRVIVRPVSEEHPSAARGAGTPEPPPGELEAAGVRLEGAAPDQRFTVRVGRRTLVYPGAVELWPAETGAQRSARRVPTPSFAGYPAGCGTRGGAGLRLINEAPIEQYLLGVVTAEGAPSFQPEALKALAVAARSYAEHNRARHEPQAEMCDTVHCQVYPGVGQVPEKVARAVADTAGIVALSGGAVIDAVFSADCGGQTRNSEDVWPGWGKIPYLRSVDDRPPNGGPDYCSVNRNHIYHLKLTPAQVGRLLGLPETTAARLALTGVERDSSGRVATLRLSLGGSTGSAAPSTGAHGDELGPGDEPLPCEMWGEQKEVAPAGPAAVGEVRTITLSQLRRSLGDQLRGRLADSVLFPDGGMELECRGLGHGVGLCQWGAQGMALPPYNHTYDEILRHYYSGITLGPAPLQLGRLALQLRDDSGQPMPGVSVRLLPGGPAGTTDAQGQWSADVPEGTYSVEARRGQERGGGASWREATAPGAGPRDARGAITFYAVRVTAGKNGETRLALVWRERNDRVARSRGNAVGGG